MKARNFNSISPSASALLLMKGYTGIPFAKEAAELLMYPDAYIQDFESKDFNFWAMAAHFENRYRSIDKLLAELPFSNVLELSSGFSLRGLALTTKQNSFYIDTDLPDVSDQKAGFVASLKITEQLQEKGHLKILPLNALDEQQFDAVSANFPQGEIIIVNEGLLMYLDLAEKEKLCAIVHRLLKQRGGYWITADIYIKPDNENRRTVLGTKTEQFFNQHRIDDKKFNNLEDAKMFFKKCGFIVDEEAETDYSESVAVRYMLKCASPGQLDSLTKSQTRKTWRLKAI